ncbi:MAG: EI24 domain-containing protein [Bacteroidales bacterium]|nr:EI24 domain-containing protein [Bacteroidales bacterium]
MTFSKQVKLGFKTYGKAFHFLFKKKLWWFFIFPLIFNILLFYIGSVFIDTLIENVKTYIYGIFDFGDADFFLSGFLKSFISGFLWLVFHFLFIFIFAYFGGYIVLIFLSPVFAFLSEKTEKINTGNNYPFNLKQFIKDIIRGIIIALRNLFIEIGITIGLFIVCLIPVIGWLIGIFSPLIIFFISSYFYGFSYLDYSLERKKYNVKQSVKIMRKYKWLNITNGAIFAVLLIIPYIGTLLASFVAIVSVVAASLSIDEIADEIKC